MSNSLPPHPLRRAQLPSPHGGGLGRGRCPHSNAQRGSAFVYLFIGIALFAALMYMISRGNEQSSSKLSDQQAKIAAAQIIDYSRTIQSAVARLLQKGCSENQISFENTIVSGYTNSNAPSDYRCHVFRKEGGNVKWQKPPVGVSPPEGNYFISVTLVCGWGSGCGYYGAGWVLSARDVGLFLRGIPMKVCQQINKMGNPTSGVWHSADSNNIVVQDSGPISGGYYPGITTAISSARYYTGNLNTQLGDSEVYSKSSMSVVCTKQFNANEYIAIGAVLIR